MSTSGVYGTRIGSIVTAADVDIFYSYSPTRNALDALNASFKRLDSSLLIQSNIDESNNTFQYDNIIEGLYNLRLPLEHFGKKGFYTIYIKPKEYEAVLSDVGVLSAMPDVRGLVIDSSKIEDEAFRNLLLLNNGLVGYRIIYFDNSFKRQDYYRLITSNNKCEPIAQIAQDTNQKSISYRYNDNSSLVFLTLTPSISTSYNANMLPYIGSASQKIAIVNTKFEPTMIEIEMVEHDIETVSTMLEGSQLRNMDNGLITTFNDSGEIYSQAEVYSLKDEYTKRPMYEVKKNKKNSIDFSQTINDK
jgi:hypothetical protein